MFDIDTVSISCSFSSVGVSRRESDEIEWRVSSIEVEKIDPIYQSAEWTPILTFSPIKLIFNSDQKLHLVSSNCQNIKSESITSSNGDVYQTGSDPLNRLLKGNLVSNI